LNKIVWTKLGLDSFLSVANYLEKNWSGNEVKKFIIKTNQHIDLIRYGNYFGRSSKKSRRVYSLLVTKHNRMYYRVLKTKIEILLFWDTRQNPYSNPYE
jgi:plasmid stabilization system protein ParE